MSAGISTLLPPFSDSDFFSFSFLLLLWWWSLWWWLDLCFSFLSFLCFEELDFRSLSSDGVFDLERLTASLSYNWKKLKIEHLNKYTWKVYGRQKIRQSFLTFQLNSADLPSIWGIFLIKHISINFAWNSDISSKTCLNTRYLLELLQLALLHFWPILSIFQLKPWKLW